MNAGEQGRNVRPLGPTQKSVLRSLARHGTWWEGSGWIWDTQSSTHRVLRSLVRRGLVADTAEECQLWYRAKPTIHTVYRLTDTGTAWVNQRSNR